MFHSLCYQSMGILRCPINWEWNSPIKAGRSLPYMEISMKSSQIPSFYKSCQHTLCITSIITFHFVTSILFKCHFYLKFFSTVHKNYKKI